MAQICTLCPRRCGADRSRSHGACGADNTVRIARAKLHFYEEPCISGTHGSGTVFFSGCNLSCVFCQNHEISALQYGQICTPEQTADLFLQLQIQGAHNINLVTPTPHVPHIRKALLIAKSKGLTLPVVYNTNAYELVSALELLDGLIDVYLPDLKYISPVLSERFSGAADYFAFADNAVREMYRQVGHLVLDENGLAVRGLLVRHLVLPGCVDDTRHVIDYLCDTYGAELYFSLMRQYVPMYRALKIPPLDRLLTSREYERAVRYCIDKNMEHVLIQQKESASSAFTPAFSDKL